MTVFEHRIPLGKTTLKALGVKPHFSEQFFMAITELWENELQFCIYHPLWRLRPTWVFNDVPTKLQRCS